MRKCDRHNDPTPLHQCRETFNLYYYEADSDFANKTVPPWNETSYSLIDKVAASYLFGSPTEYVLNKEVRTVPLNKGLRGIYFAFQDTRSCVVLMAIKVYYKLCPNTTNNYAYFPQTPTGGDQSSPVRVEGQCVPNAVKVTTPTFFCMSDGRWGYPIGGCHCRLGYDGNKDRNVCISKYLQLGPVVQSIVSLTSSLRGQLVKCFTTL